MSQKLDVLNQIEAEYELRNGRTAFLPTIVKPTVDDPYDRFAGDMQRLAQAVFLSEDATTPHVVVICGVDVENGSSRVCSELGRVLALSSNRRVCLVDGDTRSRRLSKLFGADGAHASSELDRGECIEGAAQLWIAAADVFDPAEDGVLAPSARLKETIASLRNTFEFVLIDAPGVNAHGDATTLGTLADAAILVIEASVTRKPAALRAKSMLESMNVRLLGTILNNRTYPIPEQLYRKL